MKWLSRRTHLSVARWPAVLGLVSAAVLGLGAAAGSPALAASVSPQSSLSPAAPAGASQLSAAGTGGPSASSAPRGVCSKAADGRLASCPKPLSKSALPAGAKNSAIVSQTPADLASLVDTRTWTSGGGNTYPGADVPFGMVQWSPDTSPNRSDGGGYTYGNTKLLGYSLTHISGPGCPAAGDVPILPLTGALPSGNPNSLTTSFTNTGEVAQAGYYSAQSNGPDDPITSEFTATPHTSMGRFTFPSTTSADFLIKLQDSQTGDFGDSAQIVGNNEVTGTDTSGHFCSESNNDGQVQQYTVNFDLVFSQPFTASQVITASGATSPQAVFLTFDTTSNPVIDAKVAISYVSTANAQQDLQTENPGWTFDSTKASAQQSWNDLLGKIAVSGGSEAQTQEFYSLLYKDFMQPNISSDVNGQYMGADMQVHTLAAGQKNQYGTYSGWDIYHSLSQLQAMLDPGAASDQAQSLVNYYSQDQILQQWGYLNLNNYTMVGDPAQSIIADYYAFGARSFDTKDALADMLKQATTVNDVRPGEALEAKDGYLPYGATYGCCNPHGTVATMLEYDTEDLALSRFADALGDHQDATMLEQRANNWENLFDPANGLLNPRDTSGKFIGGITPLSNQSGEPYYVEGDAYEYLWNTPNDYSALFSLLGGKANVAPVINQYLSQPNGSGMHALLSNEFDFGEQYMPDYDQDPAGTQLAVNTMLATMQAPGPSGLPNNDDLGANSSTTIWEMLGMYPENSGTDNLVFSGPHFPEASISLANGKVITINAPAQSASNFYVQNLKLNGHPYQQLSVPFSALSQGTTLDWTMGSTPSTFGSAPQDAPPSYTSGLRPVVAGTSAQKVTIAPGSTTTVQVSANNATTTNQAVTARVSAPSGSGLTITQTPANGIFHVPPSGSESLTLTISASASAPQTFTTIPITLTDGATTLPAMNLTVLVAQPGSLLTAFDNAGIASDSDPAAANFDGSGHSYSQQELAAAGLNPGQTVTVDGTQFTWPLTAPGDPDNAVAAGQKVTVNAPAGTQTLGFLGSASNGPSQGIATLNYSDGSTAQFWLGLSDWTLNGGSAQPSYGNQVAAAATYRACTGCTGGKDSTATDLFYAGLPVDPGQTLTSVTLPAGAASGQLHIFAIGTSAQPLSQPLVSSLNPGSASAGQQVTINGSGFGASQGSGYVALTNLGTTWGNPGGQSLVIDSWSDTGITFTVPGVAPGTVASVKVVNASGTTSAETPVLQISPSSKLSDYYDAAAISDDSDPQAANFDGNGNSYSAEALAAAGLAPGGAFTADGVSLTWPDVSAGQPDVILALGQTIGLTGPGTTLVIVGASHHTVSGTGTITYTDGTTQPFTLAYPDWENNTAPSGGGIVATMPYVNGQAGQTVKASSVYYDAVSLLSGKTIQDVTLPDSSSLHVFTLAIG